jgi:hypothetical protein
MKLRDLQMMLWGAALAYSAAILVTAVAPLLHARAPSNPPEIREPFSVRTLPDSVREGFRDLIREVNAADRLLYNNDAELSTGAVDYTDEIDSLKSWIDALPHGDSLGDDFLYEAGDTSSYLYMNGNLLVSGDLRMNDLAAPFTDTLVSSLYYTTNDYMFFYCNAGKFELRSLTGQGGAGAYIRIPEDRDSGTGGIRIFAPAGIPGNNSIDFVIPADEGSAGDVLKTDGAGNLYWEAP